VSDLEEMIDSAVEEIGRRGVELRAFKTAENWLRFKAAVRQLQDLLERREREKDQCPANR
jgi:hypothetical protein